MANASFSAWVFRLGPFSHCHLVPTRIPDRGPERHPASLSPPCLRVPFRLIVGQAPRASAPRGSTTQSPRSPAIPKGSPPLPRRSAAVPVAWVPSQVFVRGSVERIRRRVGGTPSFPRASPAHIASLARGFQPTLWFTFGCSPPTTTGEEPENNYKRCPGGRRRGRLGLHEVVRHREHGL